MRTAVQNRVCGLHEVRIVGAAFAGVQVAIEAREVAAGDFEPDPMALQKDVAGGPEVDLVLVDLAGVDGVSALASWTRGSGRAGFLRSDSARTRSGQTSTSLPVKSVSTAEDLANRSSVTGPVTSGPDRAAAWSRPARRSGLPLLSDRVVRRQMFGIAAQRTAHGWNGIGRIVDVGVGCLSLAGAVGVKASHRRSAVRLPAGLRER